MKKMPPTALSIYCLSEYTISKIYFVNEFLKTDIEWLRTDFFNSKNVITNKQTVNKIICYCQKYFFGTY